MNISVETQGTGSMFPNNMVSGRSAECPQIFCRVILVQAYFIWNVFNTNNVVMSYGFCSKFYTLSSSAKF